MTAALLIAMAGVVAFGYFCVCRLDRFLSKVEPDCPRITVAGTLSKAMEARLRAEGMRFRCVGVREADCRWASVICFGEAPVRIADFPGAVRLVVLTDAEEACERLCQTLREGASDEKWVIYPAKDVCGCAGSKK